MRKREQPRGEEGKATWQTGRTAAAAGDFQFRGRAGVETEIKKLLSLACLMVRFFAAFQARLLFHTVDPSVSQYLVFVCHINPRVVVIIAPEVSRVR